MKRNIQDTLTFNILKKFCLLLFLISIYPLYGNESDTQRGIHSAVRDNDREKMKLFSEKDQSSLHSRNHLGQTPMHIAARLGYTKMAGSLIHEMNPQKIFTYLSAKDNKGDTALHTALKHDRIKIALKIMSQSIKLLKIKNNEGNTPLHELKVYSRELLNHLILYQVKDFNFSPVNKEGNTPMHIVAYNGNLNLVEAYANINSTKAIPHSIDINQKNNAGNTPMHLAVERGHIEVVDYLVAKGADIYIKNNRGETPSDIALIKQEIWVKNNILGAGYHEIRKIIEIFFENDIKHQLKKELCKRPFKASYPIVKSKGPIT